MIKQKRFRLYKDLAWTFSIVSPLAHYIEETENFCKIIMKHSKIPINSLIHLGSGFGHNDYIFKKYFSVIGIDKNKSVQKISSKLNPEVRYLHSDIKKFRLAEKADCVVAVDSLDYMLSTDELSLVFQNAYNHLRSGGIFFFLLETIKESFIQNRMTHFTNKKDNIEITFIENCFDPFSNDTWYESLFLYIIRKKNKKTRVETDIHRLGLFSLDTIKKLIESIGFSLMYYEYRPKSESLEYSGLTGQEYYPMFLCLKPE